MPSSRQDQEFALLMSEQAEASITLNSSSLDYATDWIGRNLEPDDIFSATQLERWAESNGYVKE
jgi:hypothetical protein